MGQFESRLQREFAMIGPLLDIVPGECGAKDSSGPDQQLIRLVFSDLNGR